MADDWGQFKDAPKSDWDQFSNARRTPLQMGSGERAKQEAVLGLITQPVGAVAAGARGLYGMATGEDPVKTVEAQEAAQSRFTYEPRTQQGQTALSEISDVLSAPARLSGAAGRAVAESTGSPGLGAATDVSLQAIPSLIARGTRGAVERSMGRAETSLAGEMSRESWKDETLKRGIDEGIMVPPKGTLASWGLRATAGKPELLNTFRMNNQKALDKVARREASLDPNAPLSKETLERAREDLAAPYQELADISQFAKTSLRGWKSSNTKASDAYAEWKRTGAVEAKEKYQRFKEDSRHYQGLMEDEANRQGRPDLIPRLNQARIAIAKNYAVQRALKGGELDAGSLGREFNDGEKLTGGLETIGRMAADREYGQFLKPGMDPVAPDIHVGLGAGVGGGGLHVGAAEWFGKGIPLIRGPAARQALANVARDKELGMPQYRVGTGVRLSDILTTKPAKYLIPGLFRDDKE